MKFISTLRKNIGTVIAVFGFALLTILTFGDLGEVLTEQYWLNVRDNLTSIGFMTTALTLIQTSIKQGLGEQALTRGLNTDNTTAKYEEHRQLIKNCNSRLIYMPYFLQIYNERHTALKKREFLINNNFKSERALFETKNKYLINQYIKIKVHLTMARIKWATTEVIYNKYGQIQTLAEHRRNRLIKGTITALFFMTGATLLVRGLFYEESTVPFWQKVVKLLTYLISISIGSVPVITKEYEKGAFGVPNELEEINTIWQEFESWRIPKWVLKDVEDNNNRMEVKNAEETTNESRADIQDKQEKSKSIQNSGPDSLVFVDSPDGHISNNDLREQSEQFERNKQSA